MALSSCSAMIPIMRPKQAPTMSDGIKMPAVVSHRHTVNIPGNLIPNVMMVNPPLINMASPIMPTTLHMVSGVSAHMAEPARCLHSVNS